MFGVLLGTSSMKDMPIRSHARCRPFECHCQYPCRTVPWAKSAAGRGRVSDAEAQTKDPHLLDSG